MSDGKQAYLAFDLGAESGRAILACLDGNRVELAEAHRFPNLPTRLPSGFHWNLTGLWANLVDGLARGVQMANRQSLSVSAIGVDTWGVDHGLIGQSGQLLALPFAYRDERHPPAMQKAFDTVGQKAIYDRTGIQFLPFNTLYQLVATRDSEPGLLQQAARMLNTPDLLHYFFTGEMVNEATIASTSQMIDPRSGQWDTELLGKLNLPTHFLSPTVPAGTKVGTVRPEVMEEAGLRGVAPVSVVAPGSHDTASAVAAVPVDEAATPRWAYLSSGTWSLMGAELDEPVVSDASYEAGFTNERGVGGKIRFLKNISGLWLVQETRREFAKRGEDRSYDQLTEAAAQAEPFTTLVNPDHAPFASPGEMPQKFDAFAEKTKQPKPEHIGAYVRCALESLALTYRLTLESLEQITGQRVDVLHVVGGGGQNALLNQMTADALGRPVIVGPYEATAVGNALTQAIGDGRVRDLAHLRQIVRESFSPERFEPRDPAAYEGQLPRFRALCQA